MGNPKYLPGQIINGIKLLERFPIEGKCPVGKFLCHCGEWFESRISDVTTGHAASCGCSRGNPRENQRGWVNSYVDGRLKMRHKYTGRLVSCKVDNDDIKRLSEFHWIPHFWRKSRSYYVVSRPKHKGTILMHRVVIGAKAGHLMVDHINRDTLDNRKSNLRLVTARGNAHNKKNSREYPCVFYRSRGHVWVAVIKYQGKSIYVNSSPDKKFVVNALYAYGQKHFGKDSPYKTWKGEEKI